MTDAASELKRTIFAKTAAGSQEIQSRSLGLNPMLRRLLILIDGKRNFQELAALLNGNDLIMLLGELLTKGCIEATSVLPTATAPAPRAPSQPVAEPKSMDDELAKLPPASTRTAKQVDMARHFMMNTVNTVFQQNTRLTLMEAIFACKTVEDVRRVYPKWTDTMNASVIGAKRLPEFREKLFQVL